jgi:hypothetical protein
MATPVFVCTLGNIRRLLVEHGAVFCAQLMYVSDIRHSMYDVSKNMYNAFHINVRILICKQDLN